MNSPLKILKSIVTQMTKIELLSDGKMHHVVRVYSYNDDTNKFEHDESYGSPSLIDCEIEFEYATFFNLK